MASKWSEQQKDSETKRESQRVRDNMRREKTAGYFFTLSQLTFAALVLGGIVPVFENEWNMSSFIRMIIGVYGTCAFALFALRILKNLVEMDYLTAIFIVISVIGTGLVAWSYTESGKKWLREL